MNNFLSFKNSALVIQDTYQRLVNPLPEDISAENDEARKQLIQNCKKIIADFDTKEYVMKNNPYRY